MAIRSRGTNNRKVGYSEEALAALERGKYDQLTGRDPKYRTSQQQTNQVKELPRVKNMTKATPVSLTTKKNSVSSVKLEKPSTRYSNRKAQRSASITARDTSFDVDLKPLWEHRYGDQMGTMDYDAVMDIERPRWQTIREQVKRKNKWTDEEVDKRLEDYNKEQMQKMADEYVSNSAKFAKEHPLAGTLLQYGDTFGSAIEGGASMLGGLLSFVAPEKVKEKYLPSVSSDTLFTNTRSKKAAKQAVKDEYIDSKAGQTIYDIAAGLPEMGMGPAGQAGQTAAETHMETLENGAGRDNAARTATAAGAISYALGKVGLDKIIGSEGKTALGTLGKGMAAEAGEEGLETVLNYLADKLINKDKSRMNALHDYYVSQGEDNSTAWWKAIGDMAIDTGVSAGTGGLFALGLGGLNNFPALRGMIRGKQNVNVDPEIQNAIDTTNDATTKIQELSEQLPKTENRQLTDEEFDALNSELNNMWAQDAGESAPKAENKVMNESAGRNPRLVQKLEGEERAKVETERAQVKTRKKVLNGEINDLKNKAKNGKLTKAEQAELKKLNAEKNKLDQQDKDLGYRLDGKAKPFKEILKGENYKAYNDLYGTKMNTATGAMGTFGKIDNVVKFAGKTDEAVALGKQIKQGIENYIESGGKTKLFDEIQEAANRLDALAKENNNIPFGDKKYVDRLAAIYGSNPETASIWDFLTNDINDAGEAIRGLDSKYAIPEETSAEAPAPENNVPNLDGMIPGDNRKTSQYYKNTMRNTEENIKMSDEEYASRFNEEDYKYDPTSDEANMAEGRSYIDEAGGHDAAVERLLNEPLDEEVGLNHRQIDAGHILADEAEKAARELEAQGQDASDKWLEADRVHKKLRRGATINAQAMQALKKWKDKSPRGAVDNLIADVNKGIDEKKTKGYTSMVEDLADDVEDAINTTKGEGLIQKIKDIFAKSRENSSYNTEKYEQMVLDLVGGEDAHKVSSADLAAEAAKLIKKKMGVSTLTGQEERAMINLLEEASKYEKGSRAYNELVSQAMRIFDDSLPSSLGDRVKSLMYDNMLASLKTMFTRNFGGNLGANAIENIATPLQVGIDKLVSLKTGKRSRTLTGKAIVEGTKGMGKGFKDVWLDVRHKKDTTRSGQDSLNDALRAAHRTFKGDSNNKFLRGLDKAAGVYDKAVRKIMEGGDRPIYEAKYAATKAELYELVDRFGDEGLRKGLPKNKDYKTDDLIEMIAVNDALESVLQNDSTMKEAAKDLKKAISKTSEDALGFDIATMSTVPFIEVPANMASRFFQYTPVGVVGNAVRSLREIRKYGEINQRRFSGEAGRNILGGLMQAGAFGLAAAGNVSGAYSEDTDERKLQQNNGYQEYALQDKNGDTQVDISDVPNVGPMTRYGKMQYDAYKEGGIPGLIKNIPSAVGAATVDTLYQGLNKLTGASSKYNSGDSMAENLKNAVLSSVGSFILPSFVRQTAQYTDPYKRDLGDYGTSEYNKNLILNGLPVVRQNMLEPKIDTAGNEVKELAGDEGVARFLNAYLAPWKITHPNRNMSDAQKYANAIKEQTGGEVNPQPPVVNSGDLKKLKGYDAENYSHGDLSKLQKEYYAKNTELADSLISQDWFQKLDPEKQGKYLDDLYSASKEVVKEDFVREGMTPEEIEKAGDTLYTGDDRLGKIIRDDDENHTGMLEYMQNKSNLDDLNSKYDTDMGYDTYVKWETDPEKKALGGAETYASTYHRAKDLDMTVDNYLKAEKEYPGGAEQRAKDNAILKDINTEYGTGFNIESYKKYGEQGLEQRAQDANKAIEYGYVDKNGNANTDAYEKAVEIVGDNPQALKSYQNFKSKDYTKVSQKVPALIDDKSFTNSQKGMLVTGKTDPSKLEGKVVTGAYEKGGWDGVWYYYMLRGLADKDGSGRLDKQEKNEIRKLMNSDSPYVTQIPNEVYYYLGNTIKNW